jgi:hypothetical protein
MNSNAKFTLSASVKARKVGDEIVLLAVDSGTYFGLDPIGARAWELICEEKSLADICDIMVEEYEVERVVLESDLLELARDLIERKLIEAA